MPIINDNVVENDEEFTLTILDLSQQCFAALTNRSTNVTIVDDDGMAIAIVCTKLIVIFDVVISVQFSAGRYVARESSRMMVVRIVVSGSSTSAIQATVQLTPVSATGNNIVIF